ADRSGRWFLRILRQERTPPAEHERRDAELAPRREVHAEAARVYRDLAAAAAVAIEQRQRHELAVFLAVLVLLGVEDGHRPFDEEPLLGITQPAHEGVARRSGGVGRRRARRRPLRRALGAG